MSSGSRQLLPKPSASDDRSGVNFETPKRKRIRVAVACNECRNRRLKCHGERPTCSTCARAGTECTYALPEGVTSRQAEKQRLSEISSSRYEYQSVFELLRRGTEADASEILKCIRESDTLEEAVGSLAGAELLLSTRRSSTASVTASSSMPSDPAQPCESLLPHRPQQHDVQPSDARSSSRLSSRSDHPFTFLEEQWQHTVHYQVESQCVYSLDNMLPVSRWTTVSKDDKLLNHLLRLFWTWDSFMNRILDRSLFEESLQRLDPEAKETQRLDFCSSFLVNALLAASCLFTTQESTCSPPGNLLSRGQTFASEAVRLLELPNPEPSLTLFQGIGMLYLYESLLRPSFSNTDYMSRMCHIFEELQKEEEFSGARVTAKAGTREYRIYQALSRIQWGFYILDWRISTSLGQPKRVRKPIISKAWKAGEDAVTLLDGEDPNHWWCHYPRSILAQPSLRREIFDAECSFAEIVEEIVDFIFAKTGIGPEAYPQRACELYNQLMNWKDALPEPLLATNVPLPAALLLHIGFHLVVITLLCPYYHLTKAQFGLIDPKTTSYSYAYMMVSTVWTFRALYTLRNEHWIGYCCSVSALLTVFSLDSDPAQIDTFIKSCQALAELQRLIPIAGDLLSVVQAFIKKEDIEIPKPAWKFLDGAIGPRFSDVVPNLYAPIISRDGVQGEQGGASLKKLEYLFIST